MLGLAYKSPPPAEEIPLRVPNADPGDRSWRAMSCALGEFNRDTAVSMVPAFSLDEETWILEVYAKALVAFDAVRGTRTASLPRGFWLYKIVQLLWPARRHLLEAIPLRWGHETLVALDTLWVQICSREGWPLHSTIRHHALRAVKSGAATLRLPNRVTWTDRP